MSEANSGVPRLMPLDYHRDRPSSSHLIPLTLIRKASLPYGFKAGGLAGFGMLMRGLYALVVALVEANVIESDRNSRTGNCVVGVNGTDFATLLSPFGEKRLAVSIGHARWSCAGVACILLGLRTWLKVAEEGMGDR